MFKIFNKNIFTLLIIFFFFNSSFIISEERKYLHFLEAKDDIPLSFNFLKLLKEIFNINTFIETGTFDGSTTEAASKLFNKVLTIELDKNLYNQAKVKFKEKKNVQVLEGDSKEVLKNILPNIYEKALIYLDAHWSGPGTAKGDENTPILSELNSIKKSHLKNLIIVIDDIRLFQPISVINKQFENDNNITITGYPTLEELKKNLYSINPEYEFIIFGDMAIVYPKEEKIVISPTLKAMTISKAINLLDNTDPNDQILEIEKNLRLSTDFEKKAIKNFNKSNIMTQKYLCLHYIFWHALCLLFSSQFVEAEIKFNELINIGCKNPIIYKYVECCKKNY